MNSFILLLLLLIVLTPLLTFATSPRNRVAIVTGGSRGIGKGIVEALVESGEYQGVLITYNRNLEAAEAFRDELGVSYPNVKVVLVGGDLSQGSSRDDIFACFDTRFQDSDLCVMVHNAGQYAGVTSENSDGLPAPGATGLRLGDGSLLHDDGTLNTDYLNYYHNLYSTAYIDLCERSLVRMREAHARNPANYRGCLIGISSGGCNHNFKISAGYDMPGSGKCVMEFANRYFALRAAPYNINVNVVIPGFTRSDAWAKIAEQRGTDRDSFLESIKDKIPMQQIVEAKELGSVVAFLSATKGGGRLMTGLSLRVDAGTHLV
jgi:NAD(P)-dependent dehydrogenase (short-subunit alcohol dehydrogenase family)